VSFDVAADAYGRFMGRYSEPLADAFVGALAPQRGARALDVGAGTGAATARLVDALGADAVAAVDPSAPFVAALEQRLPGVDVRRAPAESLPFPDHAFDLVIAQLVVHFMMDPLAGISEMARVTAQGGTIAVSVWDFAGGRAPLSPFWSAALALDPTVTDESGLPGARHGALGALLRAAGLRNVQEGEVTVDVAYSDPEEWWSPFTLGVGPAGAYLETLDPDQTERLKRAAMANLGSGPGEIRAAAWEASGTVPD